MPVRYFEGAGAFPMIFLIALGTKTLFSHRIRTIEM
jgi:hypothetical protein